MNGVLVTISSEGVSVQPTPGAFGSSIRISDDVVIRSGPADDAQDDGHFRRLIKALERSIRNPAAGDRGHEPSRDWE